VTNEVSNRESSASETIRRIGPALVVGSALGSTMGIIVAQFLDNFGDGLMARILGGDAVLFNNRVTFTGASDVAWAGGFLLCLIVGFLALSSYPNSRGRGIPRLTLLWVILQVLRQAFMQAALLPFDSSSHLALAYKTLDAPPGLDVVIAAGGAVGLLLIALSAASAFLAFAPHNKLISNARKRFRFAVWIALVPAVAAVFLAIPFFAPNAGSGVIPALPLTAVIFLATVAAAPGTTTVRGPEDETVTSWPWGLATTLVVVLLVEILILRGGVTLAPTQWG
jgi:hypothetical protein